MVSLIDIHISWYTSLLKWGYNPTCQRVHYLYHESLRCGVIFSSTKSWLFWYFCWSLRGHMSWLPIQPHKIYFWWSTTINFHSRAMPPWNHDSLTEYLPLRCCWAPSNSNRSSDTCKSTDLSKVKSENEGGTCRIFKEQLIGKRSIFHDFAIKNVSLWFFRCREPTLCSEDFTPSSVFGTGPLWKKQPWVMAGMLKQMTYTHVAWCPVISYIFCFS